MKISRAGKQTKAYWAASRKAQERWEAEIPITDDEKAYGQYLRTMERVQGFATGWIAGVAWAKRQKEWVPSERKSVSS